MEAFAVFQELPHVFLLFGSSLVGVSPRVTVQRRERRRVGGFPEAEGLSPGLELPEGPGMGSLLGSRRSLPYRINYCGSCFDVSSSSEWDFIILKWCPDCSLWTFSYFRLHLCPTAPSYVVATWVCHVCEWRSSGGPQSRPHALHRPAGHC